MNLKELNLKNFSIDLFKTRESKRSYKKCCLQTSSRVPSPPATISPSVFGSMYCVRVLICPS